MLRRSALLSIALWAAFAAFLRVAVVPPERCHVAGPGEIESAAVEAQRWMVRAQQPDGRYVYEYDRDANTIARDYNEVRHAGVTMALYQAAGRHGDAAALAAADRATAWMTANLVRREGWAALTLPGDDRAALGASALMLVSLAERRLATGDPVHDGLMRELGRFLVAMQRPDGGFHVAWVVGEGEPDRIGTSKYYPGEALWALALLHEAFPAEGWDRPAWLALDFVTMRRDEVEHVDFPPLADQWAAYGLAEMAEWGLSDAHIDYARRLAARFGLVTRVEAQREGDPLGTLLRGRKTRAAGMGTWVEAMGSLWRLASTDERMADLRPKLEERLACAASIMAARQVREDDARRYARPELARGAWFRAGLTRMDDQQHAFSGLRYAADAQRGRTQREPDAPAFAAGRGHPEPVEG